MKIYKFELGLRLLAFLTFALFIYPIIMLSRSLLFHTDNGFIGFIIISGMGFCGMLAGNLIIKDDDYKFLRVPLANLSIIVPVIVSIIIYFSEGWLRVAFEIPGPVVMYAIGLRKHWAQYGELLDKSKITLGTILISVSLVLSSYIIDLQYLRPGIFVFAYVSLAFTLLIINQSNIERYAKKEKGKIDIFRNIRQRNLFYVLCVVVVVMLLFNLKKIVELVLSIILKIISIIIGIVFKLLGYLLPEMTNERGTKRAPEIPFMDQGDSAYSITTFVLNVFVTSIILYIVYKITPSLFSAIKRAIKSIINLIIKKFNIQSRQEKNNDEYFDEVILLEKTAGLENKFVRKRIRSLRKDLKKITDPVEKVRYIYNLILYMLINKEVHINKADTTGEVYTKATRLPILNNSLKDVTLLYDQIRYGNKIPGKSEIDKVENDYSSLADVLKR